MTRIHSGRKKTSSRIMLMFLVTYILAFTIPVVINTAIYNSQLQTTIEDYRQINMRIMKQCRDYFDARVGEMDSIAAQIDGDPVINYLFATDVDSQRKDLTYKLWLMIKKLDSYQQSNRFFLDFGVYIRDSNLLITPVMVCDNLENEYGRLFSFGGLDYVGYLEMLARTDRKAFLPVMEYNYIRNNTWNQADIILYKDCLPKTSVRQKGCIYFLIPANNIESIYGQLSDFEGSAAYISDKDGNVLYAWPQSNITELHTRQTAGTTGVHEVPASNGRMLLYSVYSPESGLTYVSMIPYSTVLHRVLYIKYISWLSAVVLFLLGVSASYILARRNSKPILDLFRLMEPVSGRSEANGAAAGFKQLHGSIAHLIENNEKLSEAMAQQMPMLKDSFFSKLFRNEFMSDRETEAYRAHLKIDIPKGPFVAVYLYLSGRGGELTETDLKEIQAVKLVLKECIQKMSGVVYACEDDFDKMIVLYHRPDPAGGDQPSHWMKRIEGDVAKLKNLLAGKTDIRLTAGGGMPVQHLSEIGLSAGAARLALAYNSLNLPVLWHCAVKDELFYFYPPDFEKRLETLVCSGNRDLVQALLDELFQENFLKRQLSEYAFRQLIFSMLSTVNHIVLNRANLKQHTMKEIILVITNMEESVTAGEFWDKLHRIYGMLCEYFREHQKSRHSVMIQNALDFITRNYGDAQLNIHSVSDHIGINPEYFSRLFKEETGEYFSDYLERRRIDTAKALLENGLRVEEVSMKVGYHSSHAFRRAFKRIYGVNPTSYRKINNE